MIESRQRLCLKILERKELAGWNWIGSIVSGDRIENETNARRAKSNLPS